MTATETVPEVVGRQKSVGQPMRRKEDARLVTGRTNWTDNIVLPGMLHMAVLRSPMAHARITRVDVSGALAREGVVAAYSGADLGDKNTGALCVWPVTDDMVMPPHLALALDKVRYVGDAVAVVIAENRYLAADALEAIEVDYEPLPPVLDMNDALVEGSTPVHDDPGTNKCYTWKFGTGDYEAAKAKADRVFTRHYVNQRLIPMAMEPRAVVAAPTGADGEVTIWSSTQIPHILRVLLALSTGIPENRIRVVAPDVGGGFGSKLQFYREEILVVQISALLGRPVKWTESRSENAQVTHHGRDQLQEIELAVTNEGKILGLRVDLLANMGAYLHIITPGTPLLGAFMFNGIYKMEALDFTCTGVFTNTTPTDAYRGAGRPEATFAIERIMDDLAAELGVDPLELRERNWIKHEEFPYTSIAGLEYDSGNYEAATARAKEMLDYDGLRREQQQRRESKDPVQLGIGVSTFTEMCGLAPSKILASLKYVAGGWEHATVRVLPTGVVEVVTGTSPHGQGHVTAWSQIAADALGVDPDAVTVIYGDTASSPYGMDTYGSRSLVVGGMAVVAAAGRVVDKAKVIAAHMLEADPDDLEFKDGTFGVKGSPGSTKTIQEVAFEAFTAHNLPEGTEPTLQANSTVDPSTFSYPHGTHLCAVEVDTETGKTTIRKYVCVDDIGNVVNPMIVEGQVHGGLAQGIGQALYEEAVYDDDGNLVTGSLVDYLVPAASDLPHFDTDRTVTPSTTNPLGVKGIGEAGTIASTPAVVNAIVDAVRQFGVDDVRMACTPERVWRAIHAGDGSGDLAASGTIAYSEDAR
ncbi:MAG: xanthine dehydrogenase family protein molybdopterin-binding subunit [Frankiaceae bacterium]|nr:xanthine dehydrogenase family protein molybdopterin-binding subunit [Frankiaceae bacterium]